MKKVKYFIFSLVCLFSCNIVFATNEITVDSMIPVYDENSGVIVTEENGEHSVIFNDKDQSVKYNIVLKNNTNKDIPIENLSLPKPTEDFLKYELTGLNSGDVIKANSTKDVVISLETVKTQGWGRNFDIELTAAVNLDSSVLNPNTSTKGIIIVLLIMLGVTGAFIILGKKNKITRYAVLVVMLSSTVTITNALYTLNVPIKINVQYESQNVMQKSGTVEEFCEFWESGGETYEDCWEEYRPTSFWEHTYAIKNIYIENELTEPQKYAYKFDVSEKKDGKVMAYLVEKKDSVCYD